MSDPAAQFTPPPGLDRRAPPPPRHAAPALVVEVDDADGFNRLVERQALRCRRGGETLSVLMLQVHFDAPLDGALGEQLLAECARRLRSRVRSTDTVVRWSERHFGVLLSRCAPEHAEAVLARLVRAAGGHYRLQDRLLSLALMGRVLSMARP